MTFNWRYIFNTLQNGFRKLSRKDIDESPSGVSPAQTDENYGFRVLHGNAAALSCKTVIVLGVERGGTSMVAGSLAKLGIYMGDTISAVYEDPQFAHYLKTNDKTKARQLIAARNGSHEIWGLKKPSARLYTASWVRLFRNPVFVVVFRDIMAVANRRAVSRGMKVTDGMNDALNRYGDILHFISTARRPSLLVSYEKALLKPSDYVHSLADFLGIDLTAVNPADCLNFIQPSPEAYRRASRRHEGWQGTLEHVFGDKVVGWAFRDNQPQPVTVILTVNGGETLKAIADISRKDVQEYHKHVSEFSGFEISLPSRLALEDGDLLSVRIAGEDADLNNSPRRYSPAAPC